jgi:hypothetical protein
MEQELKQRLDRIEAKLDQIANSVGGNKASGTVLPSKEEIRKYDNADETTIPETGKGTTTGIPDPKKNPEQYNEAMKKYDTPDGNR